MLVGPVLKVVLAIATVLLGLVLPSIRLIGPTQVGLKVKRFSLKKLTDDSPLAFAGEAGYQADLLMPGWRWAFWVLFRVEKHPWVQVPAGEIGVVISQIGQRTKIGAKSADYKPEFGNFSDLQEFVNGGGQKGVQRPVLPPGTLAPIHPVAFMVITKKRVYGVPVSPEARRAALTANGFTCRVFGLEEYQLDLVRIEPQENDRGGIVDMIGIVTVLEGDPLPSGAIASRIGAFNDVAEMERSGKSDADMMEVILGSKNEAHNNYQDFQAFLDKGGKMGLQHDPLLYGAYALNPFLVLVDLVPMLIVKQGEVAVIKAYVGLSTQDTSGDQFKFGSLVRPGHRGIWQEPLRTGKYAINPRCYQGEIVPTAILTLNWADASSQAHNLDKQLSQIIAKSKEGFVFKLDLQVQIHVPDTKAPMVISMVGTMQNLVNEVLQAAVGNHFRNKLQSMKAIEFIQTRQMVQQEAEAQVREHALQYHVETKGVYIQDVILPQELVSVLTSREIASQEVETFEKQKMAQEVRISMEQAKGRADMQADLAKSAVGVEIKKNNADARKAEADGEATFVEKTGRAQGAQVEAVGLARAKAYKSQVEALGQASTAVVNALSVLADGKVKIVPDILVTGSTGSGSLDGLAASLMRYLSPKEGAPGQQSPEQEVQDGTA
jgi:hypothetical protein